MTLQLTNLPAWTRCSIHPQFAEKLDSAASGAKALIAALKALRHPKAKLFSKPLVRMERLSKA
jgi:hypothetical protein